MIERFYKGAFPTINLDQDYILREHMLEDAAAFYEYYSKPEVAKYILASTPQNAVDAEAEIYYCRNLFRTARGIYWTLARKENDKMIGAVGLYANNFHHRAEISYDLAPEYWGQGIMAKAVSAVATYALTDDGFDRIEAVTMPANDASIKLLLKCGFVHEGLMRNYKQYNNQAHDVEMFSLTKSNLEE